MDQYHHHIQARRHRDCGRYTGLTCWIHHTSSYLYADRCCFPKVLAEPQDTKPSSAANPPANPTLYKDFSFQSHYFNGYAWSDTLCSWWFRSFVPQFRPEHTLFESFIGDFLFALLAQEISFYYVHRALHHPRIYTYIHKMHHKYITPVAFAAEYAHPIEHILANVLPVTLPLHLKGAHGLTIMAFVTFELWEAAADHSGYDFLKLPPAELHDLHHEKFRVNYGTIGLMDWIHGTDTVGWDRKEVKVEKAK